MMTKVLSAGLVGIDAFMVEVEVDIKNQALPGWSTVGLADSEVKESKERVLAAIRNCNLDAALRRVTINLAPADIPKEGTAYDLAIAVGIAVSSGVLQTAVSLAECMILGELALDGALRSVRGVLSAAVLARQRGLKRLIVPRINAAEAGVVTGIEIFAFANLIEVVDFLAGKGATSAEEREDGVVTVEPHPESAVDAEGAPDLSDICGQHRAKRALEVAAAGGHNILLSGPPGCGKTLLASRMPGILPPLAFDEALETTRVYSISGLLRAGVGLVAERPFRSPHHSISHAGLIGGGSVPRPGEVTLAHNGVLFLDELPEFSRSTLETLRQPLESGHVTIARARSTLTYPARFILVASCNPCPCGYLGHAEIACTCTPSLTQSYRSRLSGPLLDRIDIRIDVPAMNFEELRGHQARKQMQSEKTASAESSHTVALRVQQAREVQSTRGPGTGGFTNSQMSPRHVEKYCWLPEEGETLLGAAARKYALSARGIHRVLKVARTVADLGCAADIATEHLLEALQYRGVGE